jgi:hypothetical protein
LLRPEHRAAAGTGVEKLARIGRHGFRFRGGAMRTGNNGFKDHASPLEHVADTDRDEIVGIHATIADEAACNREGYLRLRPLT